MDPGDKTLRRGLEFVSDDLGVLLAVAVIDSRLVLVPVREGRVVLGEHLNKTSIEKPVDVAYMCTVFQRRPNVRLWARRNRRT